MSDDELLDVVDYDGRPLGVKRRDAVHRDGDWHRAFHLWVVSADGVLLQRRSPAKATWPGRLDATAAGHLLAGETIADGLREVEEELGVAYPFDRLTPLGVHRVTEAANHELQHVFAVRDDRPLDAWTTWDRVELAGLVRVAHGAFASLLAVAAGDAPAGPGTTVTACSWDGVRVRASTVTADDLVPAPYLAALAPQLVTLSAESD
jgi:isopentenyldiphosphate isomerase